ncbi:MAG: NAD-dependent epimerase/dehydratase family protein [Candidatus Omnitrophica bacterium]|nr:NAD-dependent epimerase/dehydratase family protein [Candidatus Omnitrophota bacterium]
MDEIKRCLVTGGAGFIGSHIVDQLLGAGHHVTVVDDLSSGKKENLPENAVLYEQDICHDLNEIFEKERPQVVFHEAAQVSVSVSVREPELDAQLNIMGSINVLEHCRRHGVQKVIYAASGAAYGEPESLPLREDGPAHPISPYGISKFTVEQYLYGYQRQFGIQFAALRYANVYGPRQDPHGEAGVMAIFCERMLKNEQCVIFGDGEQTRDFVYVEDVARANLAVMNASIDASVHPIFNVSTQVQTDVNTIYDLVAKHTGCLMPKQYAGERPGDVRDSCLANEKIREHAGWAPEIDPDEGIRRTVAYFRQKRQKTV